MKNSGDTSLEMIVNKQSNATEGDIIALADLVAEGKSLVEAGNRDFIDAQINNEEMSIILFTSGTTGVSKGVMLSHKNIVVDIMLATTVMFIDENDMFFSVLPVHHTYECTCGFLVPIYKGASIAYCEGLKHIVKNLSEAKPTVFLGVPALFESMYTKIWQGVRKKGKEDTLKKVIKINNKTKKIGIDLGAKFFKDIRAVFGGRLKKVVCGGAAINPEILQGLRDFGIIAIQGYGLTETSPISALNPDFAPNDASAGRAIPETQAKIINPDPETGIGEICLAGPHVMLGYYKRPDLTEETLIDGWYHTGDLGKIDDKGYIFITGRKKNVIITKNGKNVYPEELEYLLSNVPYVLESMVWEKKTTGGEDTTIVASIIANEEEVVAKLGENYSQEDLEKLLWVEIDIINAEQPFYKKIKKMIIRNEDFIKSTSKKIKRHVEENKD
jgi:long-chain acyl-CoA synthetase